MAAARGSRARGRHAVVGRRGPRAPVRALGQGALGRAFAGRRRPGTQILFISRRQGHPRRVCARSLARDAATGGNGRPAIGPQPVSHL